MLIRTVDRFATFPCPLPQFGLFSGFDHRVGCQRAAESLAHQTQAESLYGRFIGRTSNYKTLTKDSVQGWAGREDADGNGMKKIKEVKL